MADNHEECLDTCIHREAYSVFHNVQLLLFKATLTTRGNSIHLKQTLKLNFTLKI